MGSSGFNHYIYIQYKNAVIIVGKQPPGAHFQVNRVHLEADQPLLVVVQEVVVQVVVVQVVVQEVVQEVVVQELLVLKVLNYQL